MNLQELLNRLPEDAREKLTTDQLQELEEVSDDLLNGRVFAPQLQTLEEMQETLKEMPNEVLRKVAQEYAMLPLRQLFGPDVDEYSPDPLMMFMGKLWVEDHPEYQAGLDPLLEELESRDICLCGNHDGMAKFENERRERKARGLEDPFDFLNN